MRFLTSILALACATVATAAETYRWVDANGVVHFSDQPVEGAQRIELQSAPRPGSVAPPAAPAQAPQRPAEPPAAYAACSISAPSADQVFFNVNSVNVALDVRPGLQSGHRIVVLLNGRPVPGWPEGAQGHALQEIYRGSHTLSAVVYDARNRVACSSRPVTFHVRQPSLLSPGAQGARQRSGVQSAPGPASVTRPAPRP